MSKKKTKRPKTEKNKQTALAVQGESASALAAPSMELPEARRDIVRRLESEISENARLRGGIAASFAAAARVLAPHFSVTNAFPDMQNVGGGLFGGTVLSEAHGNVSGAPQDAKLCIEILCSAAAWLAHASDMPKAELLASFKKWAEDQSYEPDA